VGWAFERSIDPHILIIVAQISVVALDIKGRKVHKYMSSMCKMFSTLPPSYLPEIRRQSMGRLFAFCIQETRESAGLSVEQAAGLSGMSISEWLAIEDGCVPQDVNRLRAMAGALEVSFETIASMVLVCRAAWEL